MGPSLPDETSLPTLGYGITGASPIAQVVVQVSGELDIATAPRLAEELRRAVRHAAEVVVDLEQVEFMDCAGVRVLLSAAEAADAAGSAVAVTRGPAQVQRLFALTGADSLLSIVPLPGAAAPQPEIARSGQSWGLG